MTTTSNLAEIVLIHPEHEHHPAHTAALVGAGAVGGVLLAHRHHSVALIALAGLVAGAVLLAIVAWPAVLVSVLIVTATKAHGHNWSMARYGITVASWLGALVLVVIGAAALSAGGALVALAGSWALWRCAVRPWAHQLDSNRVL